MAHNIEKTVSNLVRNQFPEFYHDEGPIFVDFVTKYFEWLETTSPIANQSYSDSKQNCKINVTSGNTTIVATSNTSTFTTCFSDGQQIAIYNKDDGTDYEIYIVDTVVNNSVLNLTTAPEFSLVNTRFSTVTDQKNPLKYSRDFYDDIDVDSTAEEFLVYFKEKYLKGIQFDTQVDQRRIIKHALDIYRSKGTERSLQLLFKIAYGTDASLYYPGDDLFRASDGQWYKPRYLEVSLHQTNHLLINKQIFGYNSGATAFVEATVRKSVRGRLIDVLYISAINGDFETGELVNSEDYVLQKEERPTIIGSLSSFTIADIGTGSQFSIGDLVDIESTSGEGGAARISNTTDATGIVDISLENGGYGYTTGADVIVSESVIRLANLHIPETFYNVANDYFDLFTQIIQPLCLIDYSSATSEFANGDNIYTYHANNDQAGVGRILAASGNTSDGVLTISILSGDMDFATVYTTSNVDSATVDTYTNTTVTGNLMGFAQTANLYTTNRTGGAFTAGEFVYQTDGLNNTAVGTVEEYEIDTGANGTIVVNTVMGIFRSNIPVYSSNSGAQANLHNQLLHVGVIDLHQGAFITTSNNYVYLEKTPNVNAEVTFVSSGNGLSFNVSSTLLFPENVTTNDDYIKDYQALPLIISAYTGTVTVNSTSNVMIGAGTDFVNEIGWDLTGNVSVSNTSDTVIGLGTAFDTELSVNDIMDVNDQSVRIRQIVNSTFLVVNSFFAVTDTQAVPTRNPYIQITDGTEANTEAHQVLSVTDATTLEFKTSPALDASGLTATETWGTPGNTAANLTFGILDDIFTSTSKTIGKISQITYINRGLNYNIDPFVKIFEPSVYPYREYGWNILNIEGATSFTIGETVNQDAIGARGVIIAANSSYMLVERLRLLDSNNFTSTTNSTTYVTGASSGGQANIVSVNIYDSEFIGINALLNSPAAFSNGAITEMDILSSGFGFREGEELTILSNNNVATVIANLGTQGQGAGFYRQKGGFLSDQKRLFDGLYYQDYSYEIRSPIQLSKYEDMLKQLIHVAGTKYFGAFVFTSENAFEFRNAESIITQSIDIPAVTEIEAITNVEGPTVTPFEFLSADEIEADTNVEIPSVGQNHALLGDEIESATEVDADVAILAAASIESATSVGSPSILAITDIEAASEVDIPVLTVNHSLAAVTEIESDTNVEGPIVTQSHTLAAAEIESVSQTANSAIGQAHNITVAEIESVSNLETPVVVGISGLGLSAEGEAATNVEAPVFGQNHMLAVADEIESASSVEATGILAAASIESATELEQPIPVVVLPIVSEIESATTVGAPALIPWRV